MDRAPTRSLSRVTGGGEEELECARHGAAVSPAAAAGLLASGRSGSRQLPGPLGLQLARGMNAAVPEPRAREAGRASATPLRRVAASGARSSEEGSSRMEPGFGQNW